jgi:hypothetical protein
MTHFEPSPHSLPDAPLTMVELTWIEQKIEHWIKFGRPVHDQVTDASHRTLGFAPGTIFAPVRWASNEFGTIFSRIEVLRAPAAGDAFTTIPFVQPGAQILLRVSSWPKVARVLEAIEKIEALGIDPVEVAPHYWAHLSNRLAAGQEPRRYTRARHLAWTFRRSLFA